MTDFLSYYSGSLNNLCLWDCFYYLSLCFPFAYFFPISFSYFNTFILFSAALGVTVWHGLSLAVERESVPLLQRAGSSPCRLLLPRSTGSRTVGLCAGTQAQLLHGTRNPPNQGSNLCLLHCWADSYPPHPHRSPCLSSFGFKDTFIQCHDQTTTFSDQPAA